MSVQEFLQLTFPFLSFLLLYPHSTEQTKSFEPSSSQYSHVVIISSESGPRPLVMSSSDGIPDRRDRAKTPKREENQPNSYQQTSASTSHKAESINAPDLRNKVRGVVGRRSSLVGQLKAGTKSVCESTRQLTRA